VGIHGESWRDSKLVKDHVRGFVSDPGEFDQLLMCSWEGTVMISQNCFSECKKVFCLGAVVVDRSNDSFNLGEHSSAKTWKIRESLEKSRGDLVNLLVGALS
jgi:hypothetical protein